MYACEGVERKHESRERGYLLTEDESGANMIYTSDYTGSTSVNVCNLSWPLLYRVPFCQTHCTQYSHPFL